MATVRNTGFSGPHSRALLQGQNPDMFSNDMPRMHRIERHIYIHSVAKRDFDVKHVYFRGTLKGCKNGERSVLCYAVPDPPQQISVDAERGGKRVEVEPTDEAGWRVAIDILNPNNPTNDPYFRLNARDAATFAIGKDVDLIKFGLFPSLNKEPKEEELLRAEDARDKTWDALIQEAFQEQSSNPQGFRLWLSSHPDVFDAAEALGVEADFLVKKAVVKQACPNCGDSIKAGIAFHKGSAGVLCVLDWRRAYEAGAVKKEDVPPGKRWQGFGKVEPV